MDVRLTPEVKKDIPKLPIHILRKLDYWAGLVRERGLAYARTLKGFHNEPLKGKKAAHRSIRLSRQWRAEYVVKSDGKVEIIYIIEVHPHAY